MDIFVALYIFTLAAITAYILVSKAPINLQTPLLSATSFINGAILIGAMIVMSNAETTMQIVIGFMAVTLTSANAFGGFFITTRILKVFSKNKVGDK